MRTLRDDARADGRAASGRDAVRLAGLAPVFDARTLVLILGSFPSAASLAQGRYYAHPRNQFWPLLALVTQEPLADMPYLDRLQRLRMRRIGLWDTIVGCERPGSLDAAIRNPELARIDVVRRHAPEVGLVAFNGGRAAKARTQWRDAGYEILALPSSSPAHTKPIGDKWVEWRALAAWLAAR